MVMQIADAAADDDAAGDVDGHDSKDVEIVRQPAAPAAAISTEFTES